MKFKDIFYLQKKDRQALLTLLAIMIVCVSLTFLIQEKQNDAPVTSQLDSTNSNQEKDASSAKIHHASKSHPLYSKEEGMVHELFPFDPNTASAEDFERLGLESWQARSIIRFFYYYNKVYCAFRFFHILLFRRNQPQACNRRLSG